MTPIKWKTHEQVYQFAEALLVLVHSYPIRFYMFSK